MKAQWLGTWRSRVSVALATCHCLVVMVVMVVLGRWREDRGLLPGELRRALLMLLKLMLLLLLLLLLLHRGRRTKPI